MPGPTTEVLNEDMRELKSEVKDVKTELGRLAVSLAELRAEVRVSLGLAKWAAGFVIATVLGSGISGVWWASGISSEVKHLADVVAGLKSQAQPSPIPAPAPPPK